MDPIRYVRLELLDVLQRANLRLRDLGPDAPEQERLHWQRIAERAMRYDLQLELDPLPIAVDPSARPAAGLYPEGPHAYTAHDLVLDWSARSGVDVTVGHHPVLGYSVQSIHGVAAHADGDVLKQWVLHVDGQPVRQSLGSILVEPGREYRFRLVPVPLPESPAAPELAQVLVQVDFNGTRWNGPQQTTHAIDYDPASRPAQDPDEAADTVRPDAYTVHDLMHDWSVQTGLAHESSHHAAFGHVLHMVDGVVAHPTEGGDWAWRLYVDGEAAAGSMTSLPVRAGAEYLWRFEYTPRSA